jgi:uncharacterized protein with PIN domain
MVCNLARWLRIFGFDTVCATHEMKDAKLIELAKKDKRILLTRDKKLMKHAEVLYLESTTVKEQLKQIAEIFSLAIEFPEKTRCALCNGELEKTSQEEVAEKIPKKNKSTQFWICKSCGKVYWRGSHWRRIEKMIEEIKA